MEKVIIAVIYGVSVAEGTKRLFHHIFKRLPKKNYTYFQAYLSGHVLPRQRAYHSAISELSL